jgi:hypothetical protein
LYVGISEEVSGCGDGSFGRREGFGGQGRHLGEGLSGQGDLLRRIRNEVNPRVGSALQYTRAVSEEQAVEVVEDHEDGTWVSFGRLIPTGVPRGISWSGLRCWQDDGGAIFGQSQERQFRRATAGTDGPASVEKGGMEGQEGRVCACYRIRKRPERGSSKTSFCAQARR